jgi:hypothetical protein
MSGKVWIVRTTDQIVEIEKNTLKDPCGIKANESKGDERCTIKLCK